MNDRGLMRDSGTTSGYWYPGHFPEPVDVLNLLRRYREAERRMRLRTRGSMGMGETDLIAVRLLLRRHQAGQLMRQRDLASALEITAASASAPPRPAWRSPSSTRCETPSTAAKRRQSEITVTG